ncbi:hypothetical protein [Nocardioides ultimimeridianus]
MTATDTTLRLRQVTSALHLLRDYGGTVPPALDEARDLIRAARILTAETRMSPTAVAARSVLLAPDRAKALETAAKARAVEAARMEIASGLSEAAADNAVRVFVENADEIADAILASPRLAEAFERVSVAVERVPASAAASPRPDDLDALADVAILRRASAPFDRLLVSLVAVGLFAEDYGVEGAAGLLYADPTEADPLAVRRALRGVRPGVPDLSVWTVSTTKAASPEPFAPQGVPAAILAGTPGVRLSLATSAEEFHRRISHVLREEPAPITLGADEGKRAGLVL